MNKKVCIDYIYQELRGVKVSTILILSNLLKVLRPEFVKIESFVYGITVMYILK